MHLRNFFGGLATPVLLNKLEQSQQVGPNAYPRLPLAPYDSLWYLDGF
jgi:hypothetical protein